MDWYTIKWTDATRSQYILDGKPVNTKKRIETIKVKGGADVIDTVLVTHWGPVVYTDEKNKKFGLAMHWIIQEPNDKFELATFSDLDKGKDFADYQKAIRQFPYPAQNFAFASATGDIALTVQGKMPVKKNQQGRFVLDGTDSGNGWNGFLDYKNNPLCYNPARGFISSANQRSTDLTYPNYYNNGDFRDYRGTMVNRLLAQKEKWSVDDMKALQYNNYSLIAETALPFMLDKLDSTALNEKNKSIYFELKQWDYNYDSNQMAPVYFDRWFDYFHDMVWDELLLDTTKKAVAVPTDQSTIAFMKMKPEHGYFDYKSTAEVENVKQIIQMSFDSLSTYCEKELKCKDWAEYKDASIVHIARIPSFGKYHVRTSGSKDIINAHGKSEGPSWRMIVEIGKDKINAYGIYPGGQSGNPGSRYYAQMIDDWSSGKYYKLNYMTAFPESDGNYSILKFEKK
jgi:penicillin amidase